MTISDLPAVNASLNSLSAALVVAALLAIRRRNIPLHRNLMLAAVATSAVFLACYLTYHVHRTYVSGLGPTRFAGQGPTDWPDFDLAVAAKTHRVVARLIREQLVTAVHDISDGGLPMEIPVLPPRR